MLAPDYIKLDLDNLRIHGTVPNSNAGVFNLKLRCDDIRSQQVHQSFTYQFQSNNDPVQAITDFTPYTILMGEGITYNHTLPTGKTNNIFLKRYSN